MQLFGIEFAASQGMDGGEHFIGREGNEKAAIARKVAQDGLLFFVSMVGAVQNHRFLACQVADGTE